MLAFSIYLQFVKLNYRSRKERTYQDFVSSGTFNDFVGFAEYLISNKIPRVNEFTEFLLKASVPIKNWKERFIYEQFIKHENSKELPLRAVERSIIAIQKYIEKQDDIEWFDFFRKANKNDIVSLIRSGRISPWVIYNCKSATDMLGNLNIEQVELITDYMNPQWWKYKFSQHKEDIDTIKMILKEGGL